MDPKRAYFFEKARWICARRETSKKELHSKLRQKGCPKEWIPEIVSELEDEGTIDEARYAEIFLQSKSGKQGWGRLRIREALREKGISKEQIEAVMKNFDEEREAGILKKILAEKWREAIAREKRAPRDRAIAAAERKGHPLSRILEIMENASSPDSLDGIQPGGNKGRE
ncbi:MAG: regulatory protein RecX [Flavobacteriales bacterium]